MDVQQFRQLPILGILRGSGNEPIEALVETVIEAGLRSLEITMNTPGAPELIRRAVAAASDRLAIGAGTVLGLDDMARATDAGATFIVMPTLVREVVERCSEEEIPVFPGALTPQEIHDAWRAGATMVKVFPAKFFGPAYFKEIKGPFADIELLACGGVSRDNLGEFLSCGAAAVAFGGSVFKTEWLSEPGHRQIAAEIRGLLEAFRAHQPGR